MLLYSVIASQSISSQTDKDDRLHFLFICHKNCSLYLNYRSLCPVFVIEACSNVMLM